MTEEPKIPSVSMANTKKDLLEAYQMARARMQDLEKGLLDAEKARKRLEKKAALVTADAQAAQDPLKRLHDLRSDIGHELTSLAERFEQEIETYRKVQSAVAAKQEELKMLYEVETAASDLAALIDAQRSKKEQFESEVSDQQALFDEQMREARARWDREKEERKRQVKEEAETLNQQRQRQKEEFEYSFSREKAQRTNKLQDELQALEREISQKREVFEQETRQRKEDLDAREAVISKREEEILTLKEEVQTFPQRMEAAIQAARKQTTEERKRDFDKDKALLESKFEGQKNVLIGKIESLEKMVESQAVQITELSKRQEQAYEKVQDIASRAVEAAKRESYPSPYRQSPIATDQEDGRRG